MLITSKQRDRRSGAHHARDARRRRRPADPAAGLGAGIAELLIRALLAINAAAHAETDPAQRRRLFSHKHDLVSMALERSDLEVSVSWQAMPHGEPFVLVSLCGVRCWHVPFERLSVAAQCEVVRRVGPARPAPR